MTARFFAMCCLLGCTLFSASAKFQEQPEPKNEKTSLEYFPCKQGTKWYYNVDINFGQKHMHVINHAAKIETIDGVKLVRMENTLPSGVVTSNEHLSITDKGIYRHRYNGLEIDPPVCLLKLPVKIGETWEVDTKSGGKKMNVKAKLGSEKVQVPAGKFTCITVQMETETADAKATTVFWFAPGVGIVKQVADVGGVSMVFELEKIEPGK